MNHSRTILGLLKLKEVVHQGGYAVAPCANKRMARHIANIAKSKQVNLVPRIRAGISYGQTKQPFKSRRSIWVEFSLMTPQHELETPRECMGCGELTHPSDLKLNIEETEWLCPECINLSSCCHAQFDPDIRICSDCKEHC